MKSNFWKQASLLSGCLIIVFLSSLAAAHPFQEERGLSIRSDGAVGESFEPGELIKRVDNTLIATSLTAFAAVTYASCQATAPIIPAIAATTCVVAAVSTWVAALITFWKALKVRDLDIHGAVTMDYHGVEYKHYYPVIEGGPSVLELWQANFNDTPILVSHHTCPRDDNLSTAGLRKRQDTTEAGSATDKSGGKLYTEYMFINDNNADEKTEADSPGFPKEFEKLVGAETSYAEQGYRCMTVLDADDGNKPGAQGYIAISQDEPMADPDMEATYIADCK